MEVAQIARMPHLQGIMTDPMMLLAQMAGVGKEDGVQGPPPKRMCVSKSEPHAEFPPHVIGTKEGPQMFNPYALAPLAVVKPQAQPTQEIQLMKKRCSSCSKWKTLEFFEGTTPIHPISLKPTNVFEPCRRNVRGHSFSPRGTATVSQHLFSLGKATCNTCLPKKRKKTAHARHNEKQERETMLKIAQDNTHLRERSTLLHMENEALNRELAELRRGMYGQTMIDGKLMHVCKKCNAPIEPVLGNHTMTTLKPMPMPTAPRAMRVPPPPMAIAGVPIGVPMRGLMPTSMASSTCMPACMPTVMHPNLIATATVPMSHHLGVPNMPNMHMPDIVQEDVGSFMMKRDFADFAVGNPVALKVGDVGFSPPMLSGIQAVHV